MARTLYLNDGSTEVVIGDQEEVLGRIIEERLGRDCKELFDDIKQEWIEEPWDTNGREDYERIADYFRAIAECYERPSRSHHAAQIKQKTTGSYLQ